MLVSTANLTPDQLDAIEKLNKFKVGALFMDPGTGKTRVALELVKSSSADFTLWIVPFRTKENLLKEIEKWGSPTEYAVMGVESFSNSDRIFLETLELVKQHQKVFCIVDESLKIKNIKAKRTRRVLEIGKLCEYRLILNGTPVSKNIIDIWSQMEFLSPKILDMDLTQFKNNYVEYVQIIKRDKYSGKKLEKEFPVDFHNLEHLYSLISPFVYDAKLEIESRKLYFDYDYTLTYEENRKYSVIKNEWLTKLEEHWENPNIILAMISAVHHSYCVSQEKFQVLKEIVEVRGKDKTLVYCKYKKSQKAINEIFPNLKVLTYGKHSFGLNLQGYNTMVFFDKTFDYALKDQAEHRIYRTGQSEDCYFYNLTGNINLEKSIDKNIDAKTSLLEDLKQEIMKDKNSLEKVI